MGGFKEDELPAAIEEGDWREKHRALSPAGIAEQNGYLLRRYRDFRRAADAVVAVWRTRPEVAAVALIGSTATAPWKEVPRFSPYRRARIELWHECKDLDLAVWPANLRALDGLRGSKNKALHDLHEERGAGVASHQVDVFVLEPGSDRYLGRLCEFNRCPKGKRECLVPGCGAAAFLRQHEGFRWRPESLAAERTVRLFDRATGRLSRAADLPLSDDADDADGPEA
jgi:hypothetical protein